MSEYKCRGCGRPELHKMCPAWGTPFYMSGKLYTEEDEKQYGQMHKDAMAMQSPGLAFTSAFFFGLM